MPNWESDLVKFGLFAKKSKPKNKDKVSKKILRKTWTKRSYTDGRKKPKFIQYHYDTKAQADRARKQMIEENKRGPSYSKDPKDSLKKHGMKVAKPFQTWGKVKSKSGSNWYWTVARPVTW